MLAIAAKIHEFALLFRGFLLQGVLILGRLRLIGCSTMYSHAFGAVLCDIQLTICYPYPHTEVLP